MSALKSAESSSWIAFHGYAGGIMTLITKTGESYKAVIPEAKYTEFLKAPSQGSFFNLYIKPFAKVLKTDVAEDVALVERAKATPNSRTYKVPRPDLPPLPKKVYTSRHSGQAWLDFRCLDDPKTAPELKIALLAYLKRGAISHHFHQREARQHLPLGTYYPEQGEFKLTTAYTVALGKYKVPFKYVLEAGDTPHFDWGAGPVSVTPRAVLADRYRSAYRSWRKRQQAKAAKVKAASMPVKGETYAYSLNVKKSGTVTNPAVNIVSVPADTTQERVNKALEVLKALEGGWFYYSSGPHSANSLELYDGPMGDRKWLARFKQQHG